ncbi:hypothetical protein EBQ93_03260 [bacterium]|nr:hypothetical protein [bacterium]
MNKTFLATALIATAVYSNVFAADGEQAGRSRLISGSQVAQASSEDAGNSIESVTKASGAAVEPQYPVVEAIDSHARAIVEVREEINQLTAETAEEISRLRASIRETDFNLRACVGIACASVVAVYVVNTLRNPATQKRA